MKDSSYLIKHLKSAKNKAETYIRKIDLDNKSYLIPLNEVFIKDSQINENCSSLVSIKDHFNYKKETPKSESLIGYLSSSNNNEIIFLAEDIQGENYLAIHLEGFQGIAIDVQIKNIYIKNDKDEELIRDTIDNVLLGLSKWLFDTFCINEFFINLEAEDRETIKLFSDLGFQTNPNKNPSNLDGTKINYIYNKKIDFAQKMILTAGPSISQLETSYSLDAAQNGWNNNWSKYLDELQEEFANYLGVKHALATSSCTGALQIALQSLDIGINDEVIVPDQTWVATANAVKYVGATPIFCDVDIDSWNMCHRSLRSKITNKTKAIIPVHMYGQTANMDEIMQVAEEFNLKVVEDAAPAIGASWGGKKSGTFGDFAGFSFQGAKLLVTGEGGMLVTNNTDYYNKAKKIWNQGRNTECGKDFWIDEKGLKYKMSNIQAAIGLGQLRRVDTLIEMKRRIFSWYYARLNSIKHIKFNKEVDKSQSIYWMTSIRLLDESPISRDDLREKLLQDNIDTRPVFPSISQYPIWDRDNLIPESNAFLIGNTSMNLPSGVCLRKEQIDYICDRIICHLT